jgi:ferredoxin
MRRPVIDLSDCICCEVCVDVCPEVFRVNDAGYIETAILAVYPEEAVAEAVKSCPKDCIYWEEAD